MKITSRYWRIALSHREFWKTSQSSISGSSSGSSRKYKSSVGYLSNLCLDNSHYLVQHPLGSSYLIK